MRVLRETWVIFLINSLNLCVPSQIRLSRMSGLHFRPIIFNVTSISQVTKSGLVVDEARQKLYSACEAKGVAITVMKALGAGTLLKAESSPFGMAMTVPQCIQYCLDRSGVKVVLVGCRAAHVGELATGVAVVLAGMPMGGTTAILAEKYGADSAFASKCTALSTVLSLITTPLWCLVV